MFASRALAAAVALASAYPSAAEWRRIDSPNFVIIGDVGERTLKDVTLKLEGFRETLARLLTERATATAVPTVVIALSSDAALTPFKPTYQGKPAPADALFARGQDFNYILLNASAGQQTWPLVFHEYVHQVMSNVRRSAPIWLHEGFAEFYSTYESAEGGREARIGRVVRPHLDLLTTSRLLPLEEVLAVTTSSPLYNEVERKSLFYAQSWALVHMLLLGDQPREKELIDYLRHVGQGMPPWQAWKRVFPEVNLDRQLFEYVGQRKFRIVEYKFSEKVTRLRLESASIPPADAEALLAGFLIQQGRLDEASKRLAPAAKTQTRNLWVQSALGVLDVARGEYEGAVVRLMGIGQPADWLLAYVAAVTATDAIAQNRRPPSDELLQTARPWFETVRRQRGEIPNAVARLTRLELDSAGPSAGTRAAIERASRLAPDRLDYVGLHAEVLVRLKDFKAAREVVGPLLSDVSSAEIREQGRQLMRYIVQQERLASLRELRFGESRTEGVLAQVDCSIAGVVVFVVQTPSGVVRASASRIEDVTVISYRDDVPGSVSCGPLNPALPVYLTWRADTAKNAVRLAVAVEFPKQ